MARARKSDLYARRGVSSEKKEVHQAVRSLDPGLFPGAFSRIYPHHRDPAFVKSMHADGVGTKLALAYLAWKMGAPLSVFVNVMLDAIFMNTDDLGPIGATGPFDSVNVINRNPFHVQGPVLEALVQGQLKAQQMLGQHGIVLNLMGGETADVPDLERTLNVDVAMYTELPRAAVIDASRMQPGDLIIGLASDGQATYEDEPNSGIRSNGLTNARHDALDATYREFVETYAPELDPNLVYRGRHRLDNKLPGDKRFTIQSAMLSPTRTYLPVLRDFYKQVPASEIGGVIQCSGGGPTKIGKYGQPRNRYVLDGMPDYPAVFDMLADVRGMDDEQMNKAYNCGIGMMVVVRDVATRYEIIQSAHKFNVRATQIGYVEKRRRPGREVVITRNGKNLSYKEAA